MNRLIPWLIATLAMVGCREPEARWPIEQKGNTFLKQSAERNSRLLGQEQEILDQLSGQDSVHTYLQSASGSRYYYTRELPDAQGPPEPDDLVTLRYNLLTWNNDTLYRADEIGTIRYKVDKQELFPGLRSSVKLLREGERAVFFYPSSLAFGYHGDNERIGPNVPLKSELTLLKIERNTDTLKIN